MDDHLLMNEDDPEKRIAELERQMAEQKIASRGVVDFGIWRGSRDAINESC